MCSGGGGASTWHQKTCEVSFQHHHTGAYLGTEAGARCHLPATKPPDFDAVEGVCAAWRSEPTLWEFEPATGASLIGYHHLSRVGACAEVEAPAAVGAVAAARLTCDWVEEGVANVPAASHVQLEVFEWGMGVGGTCGAYNTSVQSCVKPEDQERWATAQKALCVGTSGAGGTPSGPGCYLHVNAQGAVEIVRAGARGEAAAAAFADPQDQDNSARFEPAPWCQVAKTRLVAQARCQKRRYLANIGGGAQVPGLLGSKDSRSTVKGAFQISTLQSMVSVPPPQTVLPLYFECWLTLTPGPNCDLHTHMSWDVDFYMRDEATRLTFAAPSDSQTQWFPDADGTIITSGNVEQISSLRGLEGGDNFIFSSGDKPGDPTTIIDFAAMGTAPAMRKKGILPQVCERARAYQEREPCIHLPYAKEPRVSPGALYSPQRDVLIRWLPPVFDARRRARAPRPRERRRAAGVP